ncbi:DUF1918 domain-containing protein [Nocardioides sp. KR10-350]|uniref:DUF1918 domain-containing protein n=1 Tax=Nocardioides cheoyonin TaxID=3156615 RepID=UPI0032B516E4
MASTLTARPGERLVVRGQHVGDPDRQGEIVEVRHADGSPPYLVRWDDTGHEGLFFPGPDAFVVHDGGE